MNFLIFFLSLALAIVGTLLIVFYKRLNHLENESNENKRIHSVLPPTTTTVVNPLDNTALNYQLQAYERMVLFLERVYPPQLILRIYNHSFSVREFQVILTESISKEFEHNLTQQIYLNHKIWKSIQQLKESYLMTINTLAEYNDKESLKVYVKKIISYYDEEENNKTHFLILNAIQQEVKLILK